MATVEVDLQDMVIAFVFTHGPTTRDARLDFIVALRELMNAYAKAAIKHGALPEKGVPHGSNSNPATE